ncbi:MAG TPA: phosphodiester glycosidase family protein [Acidimicrobiales bacterium]|nr:phosphodiester glycosidase family protein [Acidimicrobiales bacterium]
MSAPPLPERYQVIGQGDAAAPRPGPRRGGKYSRKRSRRRWLWLLTVPGVVLALFVWSVLGAYATAGNENFSAKWADWLRSHDAGFLVNHFEAYYYSHNAPKKGGQPKALNPVPKASVVKAPVPPAMLPAPGPVPLVVSPALPGEGQWQPVGPLVHGQVGMYEAQFRADTIYTSEITSAVWIDPLLIKVSMVPGRTEPGGTWPHPPYITPAELPAVAGAFNGGFRFQDAHGGFYLDGRPAVPLRTGAASLVIYNDGRVNVGSWGTDVTMTPKVSAVLQNLVLMVDGGVLSPSATYNDTRVWGSTLGANVVVARSGVGVTASGALVYVAGPALTARTLAESLQRAGAVRAMTLDINPEWVTFNFFSHPDPSNPSLVVPSKLYPNMQRSASRYLGPTEESRDFFMLSVAGG